MIHFIAQIAILFFLSLIIVFFATILLVLSGMANSYGEKQVLLDYIQKIKASFKIRKEVYGFETIRPSSHFDYEYSLNKKIGLIPNDNLNKLAAVFPPVLQTNYNYKRAYVKTEIGKKLNQDFFKVGDFANIFKMQHRSKIGNNDNFFALCPIAEKQRRR